MSKYKIQFIDEPHINRTWIVDVVDMEAAEEEALWKMRQMCEELKLPFSRDYINELVSDRNGVTIVEVSMAEQMKMANAPTLPFLGVA
jgi:hypothetical protein